MKQPLKLLTTALAAALLLSNVSAKACTGLYVGKDASADGTTIVARSEDISPADYDKLHLVIPAVENEPGRFMEDINGLKIPLPDTTFQYTMMSDYATAGDGVYSAVCTNEYGVSVTGTVSASGCDAWKEGDPTVKGGLREAMLPAAVACRSKTAREGVDTLLGFVDAYGSAEGNIVMIADQSEAWIVEIYGGHQYAAMKMPADQVAVFGNQFMIGCVDRNDTEQYVFSKDLFTTIDKLGLAVIENGQYHLAKSVCGNSRSDGSNMRTWIGHQLFAPSTAGKYDVNTFYPLFYTPDQKISLTDVMGVYRNRYEGTEYDASLEGNESVRPIAVSTTPETHIIQIRDDFPAACSAVTWLAMGGAEHSVFLPEFAGITGVAPAFQVDAPIYSPDSLYWAFKRICGLADTNRALYSQGVEDYWTLQEALMMAQVDAAAETMKTLYAADPAQGAAFVTDLAKTMAVEQMEKSDRLYASLLTTLTHNAGLSAAKTPTVFVADAALREAAEAKGCGVAWNKTDGTITLSKDGVVYTLTPGSRTADQNGEEIKLSRAPYVEKGVTYVPMDFVNSL